MTIDQVYSRHTYTDVVLLYTTSSALTMFIQDKIKKRFNINNDSVREIETSRDLTATREVYNIIPFLSDRWFFHVKDGDKLIKKDFIKLVNENTSGIYFIEFETYRGYITAKELLKRNKGTMDLYFGYLPKRDFEILYDREVKGAGGSELTRTMRDFIGYGYSGEIDTIFEILDHLKRGETLKDRKTVIELFGINSNTIDNFMFELLRNLSTRESVNKGFMTKRVREATALADKYTWSKFRSYLRNSVKNCIDVKMILSSGRVYDTLRGYQNDGYDLKRLKRYERYISKINKISIAKLIILLDAIESHRWQSDLDFITFFYDYVNKRIESDPILRKSLRVTKTDISNKVNNANKTTVTLGRVERGLEKLGG